jgi:hypothetical protein
MKDCLKRNRLFLQYNTKLGYVNECCEDKLIGNELKLFLSNSILEIQIST